MAFLEKLIRYGIDKNLFSSSQIKDLEKSCCEHCTVEVYDFDGTKEEICRLLNLRSYKSCDGLKILPEKQSIDFIEMKGLKSFLEPRYPHKNNFDKEGDQKAQISNKVKGFDIIDKIHESFAILKLIIDQKDFNLTKSEKEEFAATKKNFFIVTDINPQKNGLEYIVATLDVLSENSSSIERICSEIFVEEIENIDVSNFYSNIEQPVAMNCEKLTELYS